jgi:hypothetical protein
LNGGIHALADVTAKTAPEIAVTSSPQRKTDTVEKEELPELGGDGFACD